MFNKLSAEEKFKKQVAEAADYIIDVFDKNYARAFDFELSFNGDPVLSITRKSKEKLIKCLNDDDFKPKNDLNLKFSFNMYILKQKIKFNQQAKQIQQNLSKFYQNTSGISMCIYRCEKLLFYFL